MADNDLAESSFVVVPDDDKTKAVGNSGELWVKIIQGTEALAFFYLNNGFPPPQIHTFL